MATFNEEVVVKLNDQFTANASKIESSVKSLNGAFGLLIGGAGLAGIGIAVKKTVEAFAEQEKVQTQLSFSLRSVGVTAKSVTEDYVNFAKEMSKTSMFQDEQITQAETLFTQYGLYGDQLKRATKAAIDFASATGGDLQSAAMLFAKASEGSTAALSRYGIKVTDAQLTTKGFNAVLEASEAKFKGFGEAAINTTAGGLNQFKKGVEDVQKSIGGIFAGLDKSLGISSYLTKKFNEVADGITYLNDPTNKLTMKIQDLNKELNSLQEKVGTNSNPFMFGDSKKRINEITLELAGLNKQMEVMTKADTAGTKKSAGFMKAMLPSEQETKEFDKFTSGIIAKYAEGYDKIADMRAKDLEDLDRVSVKGLAKTQKFLNAEEAINQKAVNDLTKMWADRTSASLDAIGNLAKGNINGAVNNIKSILPPTVQSIVGVAQSAVGAIQSIFSLFADDTRTTTQFLLDSIDQIMTGINDAESGLKKIKDEENKARSGNVGVFDTGTLAAAAGVKQQDYLKNLIGDPTFQGGIDWTNARVEKDSDGNLILVQSDGKEIAIQRSDTGKIRVFENAGGLNEGQTAALSKSIFQMFKDGKLALPNMGNEYAGAAQGGYVMGAGNNDSVPTMLMPGEFVVSKKGVNNQTLGLLRRLNSGQGASGGGHVVINLSAIDEQGVAKFLKEKMAPLMREMSGRSGVVFLNQRGVSSNI